MSLLSLHLTRDELVNIEIREPFRIDALVSSGVATNVAVRSLLTFTVEKIILYVCHNASDLIELSLTTHIELSY